MSERKEVTLSANAAGERLDKLLADLSGLTRSAAVRLIEEDLVTLNGKPAGKNTRPAGGETLAWVLPDAAPDAAQAEEIPLDVVYEDEDVIVVNKPVGMVVHPAAGNREGTLVNALLWHCGASLSGIGGVIRPGIVHRIDKDTSGLLVAAKNDAAHLSLAAQIKKHKVSRVYLAVALGNFRDEEGTVDAPIGRHPVDRKRMAVIQNASVKSRAAVTHWRVMARAECEGKRFTLIRCALETGRTHQIRVHMAAIKHPLVGDEKYGDFASCREVKAKTDLESQFLHAHTLSFGQVKAPLENLSGKRFVSPLPDNLDKVIEILCGESLN